MIPKIFNQTNVFYNTIPNTKERINQLKTPSSFAKSHYQYMDHEKISFTSKGEYLPIHQFVQKAIGRPSKEDERHITSIVKTIVKKCNKKGSNALSDYNRQNWQQIISLLKQSDINVRETNKTLECTDNIEKLDLKTKKNIKKTYLKIVSARKYFSEFLQPAELRESSIQNWFKYNATEPNPFNSLHTHPVDKAKFIIGEFDTNLINIKLNFLRPKNIPATILIRKKIKLLEKINKLVNEHNWIETGAFSKFELKKLKKMVMQYEIYKKSLGKSRLNSSIVESIASNSGNRMSEVKVGEYIKDLGLVIQKTQVYDKLQGKNIPCLAVFNKESRDFSIKLFKIDCKHENAVSEFSNEYKGITNLRNNNELENRFAELEEKAEKITREEKDLLISKIHFNIVPTTYLKSFLAEMKQPEKAENIIKKLKEENVNEVSLVVDFINSDAKRYYKAGTNVGLSLIHLLKEHNCNNIFMIANAIGENKKSPLPIYLRVGFKPISHTEEEINKAMENHHFWDPKIPVYMYLPQKSLANDLVNKNKPLQEFFELNSNANK